MNVKFKMVDNSRFGWVPHTLIFKWLKDMWGDNMTDKVFWNMLLHTKNEKNQHCYMLNYWPNKGVVLVKASKEDKKRRWNELDNRNPEDNKLQGWGKGAEKGANNSYGSGAGWGGDSRGSPARPTRGAWIGWKDLNQQSENKGKPTTAAYDKEGKLITWS
eukprot:16440208-Heterocapsa_arctica.AAC.1